MPDVNPLDPTTSVGQLRLLISDSQQRIDPGNPSADPEYYFSDDFLEGFLAIESDNIKLAAADALMALAANEALVSKKIRRENLQTDGPAVATALRQLAAEYKQDGLRAQETEDGVDGTFTIVDFADPVTPYDEYEAMAGVLWH